METSYDVYKNAGGVGGEIQYKTRFSPTGIGLQNPVWVNAKIVSEVYQTGNDYFPEGFYIAPSDENTEIPIGTGTIDVIRNIP